MDSITACEHEQTIASDPDLVAESATLTAIAAIGVSRGVNTDDGSKHGMASAQVYQLIYLLLRNTFDPLGR